MGTVGADGDRREVGLLDVLVVAPDVLAVLLEHAVLVAQHLGVAEDVAGVRVARHEAQRALLAAAADEDRRMRVGSAPVGC